MDQPWNRNAQQQPGLAGSLAPYAHAGHRSPFCRGQGSQCPGKDWQARSQAPLLKAPVQWWL